MYFNVNERNEVDNIIKRMEFKINRHLSVVYFVLCLCVIGVTANPVRYNLTGKATRQSTNYSSDRYFSSAAIDGCYENDVARNCCTHTGGFIGPDWWTVNLGQTVIVNSVTVFNRDVLQDRLSQFAVYGSNSSDAPQSEASGHVGCGYRHDDVGDSYKLTCTSPILVSNILIQKNTTRGSELDVLTLCEVEIEVCPANTYGQQCKQCGHCENPKCDWTSETGDCFGGCTAGYTGSNCQSECPSNTFGSSCDQCSLNCYESSCEKFSETLVCLDGCIAGYTGIDCAMNCPDKTYGISCVNCSHQCKESECEKYSAVMVCSIGCEAGFRGADCSVECAGNTFGSGCDPCSSNCYESKCEKFSETLVCSDGCIAGYTGIDCAMICPGDTYGIGCQECPERCKHSKCQKFAELPVCTDGCSPGYTGVKCEQECPHYTYGYECTLCSVHCKDFECDKFTETGTCAHGCQAGYTRDNCTEEEENKTSQMLMVIWNSKKWKAVHIQVLLTDMSNWIENV